MSCYSVTFSNGCKIPILGLGTWKSKAGEVTQAVKDAIDIGYRHIDCARAYANEAEVGEAIKAKIEDKTVKREDLFVTSKLWNTYHSKHLVVSSLKDSLRDLCIDYLDLFLIHWPMGYQEGGEHFPRKDDKFCYSDVDYIESWLAMEECVKVGFVKSIGLSNFNKDQIERILSVATLPIVCNQVECHPYLNQNKMIEFCRAKDIAVVAYSPLGTPDRPWAMPDEPILMNDPKVIEIAEKYKKSPAHILIKYQVFDFEMSQEDIDRLDSLNKDYRFVSGCWFSDHKYFPFNTEF